MSSVAGFSFARSAQPLRRRPWLSVGAAICLLAMWGALGIAAEGNPGVGVPDEAIDRGRYLVVVGGCNECHTPGYVEAGGDLPESAWLTGSAVGWQGGWGTTYPVNLRLFFSGLTEDGWVMYARNVVTRPPMGWFVLNALTESDARAMYRFVKALGPAGDPTPAYVPPGAPVDTPVIRFPEGPPPPP